MFYDESVSHHGSRFVVLGCFVFFFPLSVFLLCYIRETTSVGGGRGVIKSREGVLMPCMAVIACLFLFFCWLAVRFRPTGRNEGDNWVSGYLSFRDAVFVCTLIHDLKHASTQQRCKQDQYRQ